ncbi:hypothetical protein CEXT_465591 [Caerostris extrusa]|uniref:Uncharacterized protein n=1 Tax=Caerostris extrusa TaxID=172846 RepID=A0AAV4NFL9_CAEEX|nr:hypothetical protein CEXT_465591 [Caerostris extrusa]
MQAAEQRGKRIKIRALLGSVFQKSEMTLLLHSRSEYSGVQSIPGTSCVKAFHCDVKATRFKSCIPLSCQLQSQLQLLAEDRFKHVGFQVAVTREMLDGFGL